MDRLCTYLLRHTYDLEGEDSDWTKPRFPRFYDTDLIELCHVLAHTAHRAHPTSQRLLRFVLDLQDADGRWHKQKVTPALAIERIFQPSRWLTFEAVHALVLNYGGVLCVLRISAAPQGQYTVVARTLVFLTCGNGCCCSRERRPSACGPASTTGSAAISSLAGVALYLCPARAAGGAGLTAETLELRGVVHVTLPEPPGVVFFVFVGEAAAGGMRRL